MSTEKEPSTLTSTDKLAHWLSWLFLVLGTLVSAYLNSVHAARVGDAAAYHVAAPLIALLMGLYAEVILLSTYPRIVRWTAGIATTSGFLFAMASSYVSILAVARADMANAYAWMQAGTAALPDAVMILAVTVLVAHRWRSTRSTPATDSDRQPNRFRRLTTKAFDRIESKLDKPATPQVNDVNAAPTEPVNVPEAVSHNGHGRLPVPDWARSVNTLPERPTPEPVNAAATDRHMHEAQELLDRTGKRVAVETLAQALAALDDGTPIKTISRELGMGERTLREVRDARLPLAHRLANAV